MTAIKPEDRDKFIKPTKNTYKNMLIGLIGLIKANRNFLNLTINKYIFFRKM